MRPRPLLYCSIHRWVTHQPMDDPLADPPLGPMGQIHQWRITYTYKSMYNVTNTKLMRNCYYNVFEFIDHNICTHTHAAYICSIKVVSRRCLYQFRNDCVFYNSSAPILNESPIIALDILKVISSLLSCLCWGHWGQSHIFKARDGWE